MGGMGKTAVAQLAYNDEKVKAHFDKRIWVCVSDPFEKIKIAKAIIEQLNIDHPLTQLTELQTLLNCIFESIKGKKFLLVLDDVWNPSNSEWEQLKEALQNGAIGSRIVVTTRKEEVPIMIGATSQSMHLEKLSEDICLLIFNKFAFFDKERDRFEEIGKKIIKKCGGLPLAAKTLGSLMRSKKTIKEWEDVLESKIWDLKEVEQEVFQSFLLSYYDLNPAVKRCLLYCATFPKDYEFDIDELIDFWMSQDYLNLNGNKKKERIVGEHYLNNLIMRSFFQDFKKDEIGNIVEFKMHDIVHDFIQILAKNECCILEANNVNEIDNNKVRHVTLMYAADNGSFPISLYKLKKLHTLLASGLEITSITSDLIQQIKCLRTLALGRNSISALPVQIGELIHLRYLDLSFKHDLKELRETLGNLYNLQTLRLTGCDILEKLPETIRKLIGLKNLYVAHCDVLQLCKDIESLTSLETLDELAVYDNNNKKFTLGSLKNFDQLRERLRLLNLGKLEDVNEAKKAELVKKKHLLTLSLDFTHAKLEEDKERKIDEEILNALQPHTNLEELVISRFNGTTLYFDWMMSLQNLKSLFLGECHFCACLPPLGKLPYLECLDIIGLPSVRKVGVEFLGIDGQETLLTTTSCSFPNLKQLSFNRLEEWQEWEGVVECGGESDPQIQIMPCLSNLQIYNCRSLKAFPDFLRKTPLKNLTIHACGNLEKELELGRGMLRDKVSHIPNFKITSYNRVHIDGVWMDVGPCGNLINLE